MQNIKSSNQVTVTTVNMLMLDFFCGSCTVLCPPLFTLCGAYDRRKLFPALSAPVHFVWGLRPPEAVPWSVHPCSLCVGPTTAGSCSLLCPPLLCPPLFTLCGAYDRRNCSVLCPPLFTLCGAYDRRKLFRALSAPALSAPIHFVWGLRPPELFRALSAPVHFV